MAAIFPPKVGHVNTVIGTTTNDLKSLVLLAGEMFSLPCDALIKILGKDDLYFDSISKLPLLKSEVNDEIIARTLILNCVTSYYGDIWNSLKGEVYKNLRWTKDDNRLSSSIYDQLNSTWSKTSFCKNAYERRQVLIELDVLVAFALGMSLELLKAIYNIQFPVLKAYEENTWYDVDGKIVFTTNRSLSGVGVSRTEWERGMKGAVAGKRFYQTVIDDTKPGAPVERIIEYIAPFDSCDREKDYETAWKFFEEKYGEPINGK